MALMMSATFLLPACGTVGSKVAEDVEAIPPGKGLVVFSTGADQTNLAFSTGMTLVQAETRKRYDKVTISIDYPFASHFPPGHAHVRSLALPQGDYFLIARSGNPALCLLKFPTFRFTVKAGVVNYLGSFQLAANRIRWVQSNRDRDVQYFLGKNPKLRSQAVSRQDVIVGTEAYDSCDQSSFTKGVIWEAP